MIVQPLSDMHKEMGLIQGVYDKVVKVQSDVLVLAGDIAGKDDIIKFLIQIQHDAEKPVVFVPGNHEYYGTSRVQMDAKFRELNEMDLNIYVLLEDKIKIGDVWFVGSTGWWDGSNGGIGQAQRRGLNDFRMIRELKWIEGDAQMGIAWGRKSRVHFEQTLHHIRHTEGEDAKIICVSHNYPHPNSLAEEFIGSPLNACFGNRWEHIIEKYHPTMWIHGHTHYPFDYWIKDNGHSTHVVCNPQGYPMHYAPKKSEIKRHFQDHYNQEVDEATMAIYTLTESQHFDPEMVVEV